MSEELNTTNNFLLYTNEDGEVKVDVLLKDETIWYRQKWYFSPHQEYF